ncbi:MAG: high frequency lysogenization protein [Halieaceae bacterium]|jgi:high frequency lysogenization protein
MQEYTNLDSQVIGLSGAILAAAMVGDIAQSNRCDSAELNTLIASLFQFDPEELLTIYGGLDGIRPGLSRLVELLDNPGAELHRDLLRYLFGMGYLQRKMRSHPEMSQVIRSRLQHSSLMANHFTDHVDQTCDSIAAIYQDTLSTFSHRIQVTGKLEHLQNPANSAKIRTLLLAGIRSLHLWNQQGGAGWKLIVFRSRYRAAALRLLAQ